MKYSKQFPFLSLVQLKLMLQPIDHLTDCVTHLVDRSWNGQQPQHGFCGETDTNDGGDCRTGNRGSWHTGNFGIRSLNDCIATCRCCSRCDYVSYSARAQDCSWYAADACNYKALRSPPLASPDFITAHVGASNRTAIDAAASALQTRLHKSSECDSSARFGTPPW